MAGNGPMPSPKEVVIPKEQATFRLDGQGRWHNNHGPLTHPRIISLFHNSIRNDQLGYHLYQDHGTHVEKVYFPYEDTALFVWDLEFSQRITLILNTRYRIQMSPVHLCQRGDGLYYLDEGESCKFTDRALVKLAPFLDETGSREEGGNLILTYQEQSYTIRKSK